MKRLTLAIAVVYFAAFMFGCLVMGHRHVGASSQVVADIGPIELIAGQGGDLICYVPRAVINVSLALEFMNGPMSELPLQGEKRTIFLLHNESMPCTQVTASCTLTTTKDVIHVFKTKITSECN